LGHKSDGEAVEKRKGLPRTRACVVWMRETRRYLYEECEVWHHGQGGQQVHNGCQGRKRNMTRSRRKNDATPTGKKRHVGCFSRKKRKERGVWSELVLGKEKEKHDRSPSGKRKKGGIGEAGLSERTAPTNLSLLTKGAGKQTKRLVVVPFQ